MVLLCDMLLLLLLPLLLMVLQLMLMLMLCLLLLLMLLLHWVVGRNNLSVDTVTDKYHTSSYLHHTSVIFQRLTCMSTLIAFRHEKGGRNSENLHPFCVRIC